MQSAACPDGCHAKRGSIHYELIMTIDGVKVKVPRQTLELEETPAHTFVCAGRRIWVEDHYQISSCHFGRGIVQRNFFRFAESDLGKNCVATVKASYKTTRSGKKILLLDIFKAEDAAVAQYELRFVQNHGEIEIPDSANGGISFEPIKWPRH
jgi:hypothetical protein